MVRAVDIAALAEHPPLGDGDIELTGETVAKVLFTARSSGETKGVVHTHAMLCAMLEALAQTWPFLDEEPPVVVDRLPWHRSFGGNTVLGIVLRHAGTLYVDPGGGVRQDSARSTGRRDAERSAELRASIAPTLAFDVPLGWAAWVERVRADDALRRRWLARLRLACWTGAPLARTTRDALRALGVPLAGTWGATETTMTATVTGDPEAPADAVGMPVPGIELKLVPAGTAFEARVRGAQVTTGYWWRADLTAAAFDDEGFYRSGDLLRPVDARAPQTGLAFAGRLDDRFKLASGTWVRAGELRAHFLAACPDAADVVVTGDGRAHAGLLVWPRADTLLDRAELQGAIADAMRRTAAHDAAREPARALVVGTPLDPDEYGPDGTPDRATVLSRRAALVARLNASEPDADVIVR